LVTTVINPRGKYRANEFARCEEYVIFVAFGTALVQGEPDEDFSQGASIPWRTFRRSDITSKRGTAKGGTGQFYPVYVTHSGVIDEIGEPLPRGVPQENAPVRPGCVAVFPMREDGTEMNWGLTVPAARTLLARGFLRVGRHTPDRPQQWEVSYLTSGRIADIDQGRAAVAGSNADGSVIASYVTHKKKMPVTTWNRPSHNAETHGTEIVKALLGEKAFPFPKSLYAVEDALRLFIADKPNAIVVDFFCGSGTTGHAVMRLNKQDGGLRRSICVTNNELSLEEEISLRKQGLRPGDAAWEIHGICEYITKPRVEAAITGRTPKGQPIKGDYKFTDEFPIADGFEENVEFFTLTYEAPLRVASNREFAKIAPLLWMRAGSRGRRIEDVSAGWVVSDTYGVLADLDHTEEFLKAVAAKDEVAIAYVVTRPPDIAMG
jgi:adenine-specific DNA-methyltransferase